MSNNKQTAMQELIDKISRLDYAASSDEAWARLKEYIRNENLLEKEKQQIIDAIGVGSQFDRDYLYGYHDKAEQYYNEIFKPEI